MIEWDNKYSVGISIIDEKHKEFIDIIKKAVFVKEHNGNLEKTKEVIGEMLKYSCKHFSMEEAYMTKFKCPEYQLHRDIHLDFADKAIMSYNKLISGDYQIVNEILEFLKQWLMNHIQGTDTKYIDCLKRNGFE